MGSADFFGHVAPTKQLRGMFGVFYDISPNKSAPPSESKDHILVATISGEAVTGYQKMADSLIVELCVRTLQAMFPREQVPQPSGFALSRWGGEQYAQMSYSYVAVGSSGMDYDILAEEVEGKVFFAGEVSGLC